jgi:predicted ATP-binding protein involved in virulence
MSNLKDLCNIKFTLQKSTTAGNIFSGNGKTCLLKAVNGVLGTMERKVRLSFRHIPSQVSARAIPSRWQDCAEAAVLLSSPPPA